MPSGEEKTFTTARYAYVTSVSSHMLQTTQFKATVKDSSSGVKHLYGTI
jgi:hypothetical protein